MLALVTAAHGRFEVPADAVRKLERLLDRLARADGTFACEGSHDADANLTAQALVCRLYLGALPEDPDLRRFVEHSIQTPPAWCRSDPEAWFFESLVLSHCDRPAFSEWMHHLRQQLHQRQNDFPKTQGSIDPRIRAPAGRGRFESTCLCLDAVAVDYRYATCVEISTLSRHLSPHWNWWDWLREYRQHDPAGR
jgi:hypothetical protein